VIVAARAAVAAAVLAIGLVASPLLADAPAPHRGTGRETPIERMVVRYWAPETGGPANPRFLDDRGLAFEARLAAMGERQQGLGDGYQERHVRDAMDHAIGEEMLASLANNLLAELPAEKRPTSDDLARIDRDLASAEFDRLGGRARVDQAAAAEGLEQADVEAILRRQALAAWYVDRVVTPVLAPSEEQLREVFRTSAHPFQGRPYEKVRAELARWLVFDLVRAAESAFLQAARSRVKVVVTR
jgi:hypothetical protein